MNTQKKTATIVGILFIIGTVAGILSAVFTGPILGDPDYLMKVAANETPIIFGALYVLIMGLRAGDGSRNAVSDLSENIMKPWRLGLLFSEGRLKPLPISRWSLAGCCSSS